MKFSAQEEYGLRCLLSIARRSACTIPELARIEGLSPAHVAKLLGLLRGSGFITSTRGQLGGYTLALAPEQIVIGEVLERLGGKLIEDKFCERHAGVGQTCAHEDACSLRPLWGRIQNAVDDVVFRLSLKDLLDQLPQPPGFVRLGPGLRRQPLTNAVEVP